MKNQARMRDFASLMPARISTLQIKFENIRIICGGVGNYLNKAANSFKAHFSPWLMTDTFELVSDN